MGLAPNLLPGRVSTTDESAAAAMETHIGHLPTDPGRSTMDMFEAVLAGDMKALILAGADQVRDCPDPDLAARALEAAEFVVAIDAFLTDSSRFADVFLPAAVWGEVDGTATNLEGRVQRVRPSIPPIGRARPLNAILDDLAVRMGVELGAAKPHEIAERIAAIAPAYAGLTHEYLEFEVGDTGVVVPSPDGTQPLAYIPVEISVPVVTDRMTLHLAPALYDDGVWNRYAATIASLVRPATARIHPRDAASLAVTDGSVIAVDDDLELPVTVDSEVAVGSIVVPFNHPDTRGLRASPAVRVDVMRGDR
jgi:predicted molibdopterin-dependent oxidoreductase YjgC